jgi:hypothetical protein
VTDGKGDYSKAIDRVRFDATEQVTL